MIISLKHKAIATKFRFMSLFIGCLGAGCVTTGNNGVVEIGDGTYMIGGLGGSTYHSGSFVKAKFFKAAREFCDSKRGRMIPLNSTAQDASGILICVC